MFVLSFFSFVDFFNRFFTYLFLYSFEKIF